jgi:hypothetical protein
MVLFVEKIKGLECPYGLRRKLQLMNGSLVWLPLRRTRHHRTIRLLLHFHVTSAMMPPAPPAVAPPPVLRQSWETLAWHASRWSKPPDVNMCPHTVFIHSSILRRKPINLLPHGFKGQTKKPSWWFWGPNHQTVATDFDAKSGNSCFSSPPRVRCGSHTVSPDLLIVQPPSNWLVPDHP